MSPKKAAAAAYRPEWNRRKALRPTPPKFVHVSVWYEWYVPEQPAKVDADIDSPWDDSKGYYRSVGKPRTFSRKAEYRAYDRYPAGELSSVD